MNIEDYIIKKHKKLRTDIEYYQNMLDNAKHKFALFENEIDIEFKKKLKK